jgi:hypothetical protein
MSKEFIPYEEALALIELGFNEHCFAFSYIYEGESMSLVSTITNTNSSWNTSEDKSFISSPLYQQAFRWFRENHKLYIVIKPIDDKKLDLGYNLLKNGLIISAHLTYEEAELACLRHLINRVKGDK